MNGVTRSCENPAPVRLAADTETTALPELLRVTTCETENPTGTSPKSMLVGLIASRGCASAPITVPGSEGGVLEEMPELPPPQPAITAQAKPKTRIGRSHLSRRYDGVIGICVPGQ